MRYLLFASFLLALAPEFAPADIDERQTRIDIGKMEESIQRQEDKLMENAEQERSVLEELQRLDMALDDQRVRLSELRLRQDEQRAIIEEKEQEQEALAGQHRHLQEHLMRRMKSYYLMGRTGLFNALFSSESMTELARSNEAFRSLVTYDQKAFERFRASMEEINASKDAVAREQAQLDELIAQASEAEQGLLASSEEQKRYLERIQTERVLYEQAIREINQAQRHLSATLDKMAEDEKNRAVKELLKQKGKLPPPIKGPLVRKFMEAQEGEEQDVDSAPFLHGITIGISSDEEQEVRAVYAGVVIFADYMPGYGKTVIIEHAHQYYTVTSKFAKISVGEKTQVEQGDVLGTTDNFSTLIGKGLYFEIRNGAEAEDPLPWLRPDGVTSSDDPAATVDPATIIGGSPSAITPQESAGALFGPLEETLDAAAQEDAPGTGAGTVKKEAAKDEGNASETENAAAGEAGKETDEARKAGKTDSKKEAISPGNEQAPPVKAEDAKAAPDKKTRGKARFKRRKKS